MIQVVMLLGFMAVVALCSMFLGYLLGRGYRR